jgi:hypothetical protein
MEVSTEIDSITEMEILDEYAGHTRAGFNSAIFIE